VPVLKECAGTNTYLVGHHNPYILIDTGEGKPEYIPHLEEALRDITKEVHTDLPDISDIIITHKHHDHCGGLPSVLSLLRRLWEGKQNANTAPFVPPRIHKLPLPTADAKLQSVLDSLPQGSYTPGPSEGTVHDLRDGQLLQVTDSNSSTDAASSVLQVIHTPGHTADSLCLYYPAARALFTADTVLGHGSAVFEDLGPYMFSLRKLIDFGAEEADGAPRFGTVYPGHGPVVPDGLKHIRTYLQHRVDREDQILKVLQWPPPSDDPWTTWTLVSTIYADYPQSLWEPAAASVSQHLRKLEAEGRVECLGGSGKRTEWEFIR